MSCRVFSFHSVVPIILSAACLIPHGEELALTCVPWYAGPRVSILSGTERGITLGTPIGLFVPNQNVRPMDYSEMSTVPRPGHAEYTYELKYGTRASSGGGRSSARETIGRVAAGAIAEKWLRETYGTEVVCFVSSVGDVELPEDGMCRPDGTPWSRAEVDARGTLRMIMRGGWRKVGPQECGGDEAKVKELQKELDAQAEADFLAAGGRATLAPNPTLTRGRTGRRWGHHGVLCRCGGPLLHPGRHRDRQARGSRGTALG